MSTDTEVTIKKNPSIESGADKGSPHLPLAVRNALTYSNKDDSSLVDKNDILDVTQLWRLIKINRFTIATFAIGAAALTGLYSFFSTPEFKSSITVSVVPAGSYRSVSDIIGLKVEDNNMIKINTVTEYFHAPEISAHVVKSIIDNGFGALIMLAEEGPRRILTNLGLLHPIKLQDALKDQPKMSVMSGVMSHLVLKPDYNNNTIAIESTTSNPGLSAFLANTAGEALLNYNHKMNLLKTAEVKQYLISQAAETGNKLQWLESKLSAFQSQNRVISPEEAEKSIYSTFDHQQENLFDNRIRLETNLRMTAQIQREMKVMRENINKSAMSGSNLYLPQLQHRLSMLQYQEEMLQNTPGADPVEEQRLKAEIDGLANSYKSALESRGAFQQTTFLSPLEYYQNLEQSLALLKKDNKGFVADLNIVSAAMTKHNKEFPRLALTMQRITALKRNIQLTTDLYLALKKKLQETEIQEAATIDDISILAPASVPNAPHALSLGLKLAFAFALGIFFGLFLVISKENLIPTIRSRFDLEKEGVVVLGEMPVLGGNSDHLIIANERPTSYEADVLRAIRQRLVSYVNFYVENEQDQKPGAKTLLITSPRSQNGKTFITVNLASALAKAEYRTLIIDLHLRSPSVHDYFQDIKAMSGLNDLMNSPSTENESPSNLKTPITDHLDVIFGGKNIINPAEFLDSKVIPHLIERERQNYDYIIVDAPPVLGVIDTLMVAPLADMVVLVAEHRKTLREDIVLANDTLGEVYSRPLLGIINCVCKEFTQYNSTYFNSRRAS